MPKDGQNFGKKGGDIGYAVICPIPSNYFLFLWG